MDYSSAASSVILLFHCIAYSFFYSFIVSSFIVYCVLCMRVCVCVYGNLPDSNKDLDFRLIMTLRYADSETASADTA